MSPPPLAGGKFASSIRKKNAKKTATVTNEKQSANTYLVDVLMRRDRIRHADKWRRPGVGSRSEKPSGHAQHAPLTPLDRHQVPRVRHAADAEPEEHAADGAVPVCQT